MRQKLQRPGDGELERLLIRRAVLCWLSLHTAEVVRTSKFEKGLGAEAADFWDRHVSRLNSDFLKSCKTLAVVRRLLRQVIAQVNIAEQQVNVTRIEPEESTTL